MIDFIRAVKVFSMIAAVLAIAAYFAATFVGFSTEPLQSFAVGSGNANLIFVFVATAGTMEFLQSRLT